MDITLTLPYNNLQDNPTLEAAHQAFGISYHNLQYARDHYIDINIKCTESQFGMFIALRVTGGCKNNQIRIFNVKLVKPAVPAPKPFNPNFDVR